MRYEGPLPTIAMAKAQGINKIRVWCEDIVCFHSEVFEMEQFGLPDDTPVIHIPKYRRFVCSRCGGRRISVRFERPPAPGTPGYKGSATAQ